MVLITVTTTTTVKKKLVVVKDIAKQNQAAAILATEIKNLARMVAVIKKVSLVKDMTTAT